MAKHDDIFRHPTSCLERVTAQQVGNGGQIGRAEKRRSNPTPAWAGRCDYGMGSISSGGALYLMNSLG